MDAPRPAHASEPRPSERSNDKEHRQRPVAEEELDAFRAALDARRQRDGVSSLPDDRASQLEDRASNGVGASMAPEDITLAALMAQQAWQSLAQSPIQVAEVSAPHVALADLLERHVRRMLATESASNTANDGKIRLTMNDSTLPATELTLERHSEGWRLIANVGTRDAYEMVNAFAPSLVARFSDRDLGQLEIEPVFEPEIG